MREPCESVDDIARDKCIRARVRAILVKSFESSRANICDKIVRIS